MGNIRWVGTPCRYARSGAQRKRTDRWMIGLATAREHSQALSAEVCCAAVGSVATFCAVLFFVVLLTA